MFDFFLLSFFFFFFISKLCQVLKSVFKVCVLLMCNLIHLSIEMEAVAEAVTDMQAILLRNETNADKLEMWNVKKRDNL